MWMSAGLLSGVSGAILDKAPRPQIILDTDYRSDVDDVGALALLNAFADRDECALLGVMASQTGPHVVGAINAVNTYYGRGDAPIGLSPVDDQRFPDYYAPGIGNPNCFPITQTNQTAPDTTTLYRRLLFGAPDQSVVIVVIGGQTCIHLLLTSEANPEGDASINQTGKALITAKVRELVIMGGHFTDPDYVEHNIKLDPIAAQTVAAAWPTPIIYAGFEIGQHVLTGATLTEPASNPVARAYALFPKGGVGIITSSSSFDQTAVYCAIRGPESLWRLSEPGHVTFPESRTRFQARSDGLHRYLISRKKPEELAAAIEPLMGQSRVARRLDKSAPHKYNLNNT